MDCRREAVLTRSPTTRPFSLPPGPTEASPVRIPTRSASSGEPWSEAILATLSTNSMPARTARSASSSLAVTAPHTAITASPMNLSTTPPNRSMTSRLRSK